MQAQGIVLVWAEIELNLFIVTCMGLCLAEKDADNSVVDN